ncbi:MAG: signal transduction histidine kinase/DNA-binding response OmpR family regulator [Candidatus Omnitrophota bacterium]|jgi:signal transduction histidine kinase/DNA-binding response OmpR family regulator
MVAKLNLKKELEHKKGGFRWYHMYFLFAALDVVIILASLYLQHGTLGSFKNLVNESKAITHKQEWIASMRSQLLDLNSYGNDVFGDRDVPKYENGFNESHNILTNLMKDSPNYDVDVTAFSEKVVLMTDAARNVFRLMGAESAHEDNKRELELEATGFMALMDQKQAFGMGELASIEKELQTYTHHIMENQLVILKEKQKIEWVFAFFVAIAVICIIFFGRRMHIAFSSYMEALREEKETAERLERQTREAEIRAKQSANEAINASKTKSQFLANMSHEIRTPLNAIIGFSQLLENSDLDPAQKRQLRIIVSSGHGLLEIINDILDISKIEAEGRVLESIDFNFERLIEDTIAITSTKLKESTQIELYWKYPKNLPKSLHGDPTAMRQILLNFMGNSVKFTEKGSVGIIVEEDAKGNSNGERSLTITIKDTGIGIPEDQKDHIFGSFSQADESTTRKFGGTGLGLAIAKSLIELMGGSIRVESKLDKGSEFIFKVKLKDADKDYDQLINPVDAKGLKGKTVFILDDNEHSRALLRSFSEELGMTVLGDKTSACDALSWLDKCDALPDIILLDIMMPGMDGYSFAKIIKQKESFSRIKLMCVTSDAVPGTAQKAKDAGIDAYLPKPVMKQDFLQVLATMMGDGRTHGQIVNRHLSEQVLKGTKILVAEDNIINQELIKALLSSLNCEYEIANNGKEAVDKMRNNGHYGLVLMDLQMPIMGGLEATREIRKTNSVIPIIALTAAVLKEDKEASESAGMNDFIAKPIQLERLKAAIIKWS